MSERIFSVIENGGVVNTFVADYDFVSQVYPDALEITELEPRPGIGWFFDGTTFTSPGNSGEPVSK